MSYAFDSTAVNFGSNLDYLGIANNYVAADLGNQQGSLDNEYGGVATNFTASEANEVANSVSDQDYSGVMTNFNTTIVDETQSKQMDNNPILLHPKDQKIYYKLSGYNPNTSLRETWIISEQIVPRPELFDSNKNPPPVLFDPNGNPPNVDLGVFYTPPSGNPLVDIKIVGRWIQ